MLFILCLGIACTQILHGNLKWKVIICYSSEKFVQCEFYNKGRQGNNVKPGKSHGMFRCWESPCCFCAHKGWFHTLPWHKVSSQVSTGVSQSCSSKVGLLCAGGGADSSEMGAPSQVDVPSASAALAIARQMFAIVMGSVCVCVFSEQL